MHFPQFRRIRPPLLTSLATCLAALLCHAAPGEAQTGVSDDRVSLPDGSGSVEGVGDNAQVDPNMGALSYEVPVEVAEGFPGLTPDLTLRYSSSAGNSALGMGWSLGVPSIERMTARGLPRYTADDEFVANGGEQLVRVSSGSAGSVYRARFERGFVRYTWKGEGPAGFWTAEYPDGRIGFFGAAADGIPVASARLTGAGGQTFRYYLVEMQDRFGHAIRYDYTAHAGTPHLSSVRYVFDEAGVARYQVDLGYADRPDKLTDCKPGFCESKTRRLSRIAFSAFGEVVRSYQLQYEELGESGGLSRLRDVTRLGRDGKPHPIAFSFGYSQGLSGVCDRCTEPFVVNMGKLDGGVTIGTGGATLVDLNGDSLPDVVDTSREGKHRIFYNRLMGEGRAQFETVAEFSDVGTHNAFDVSVASVQVLDLNGDGFADMANSVTQQALCNLGTGDWSRTGCGLDGVDLDLGSGDGAADPLRKRFLDVDNDRRIDMIETADRNTIQVWHNTADEGFIIMDDAMPIGRAFDEDRLELSDINGDGLLDPVQIDAQGFVHHYLNLGHARWAERFTMDGPLVPMSQLPRLQLEDVNADGLDDLVIVLGYEVRYALNRNGDHFDSDWTVIDDSVAPGLPYRDDESTTILFADMNANGTRDVVWIERTGEVNYLELFPVPPNLLSRIENGIGGVEEIHYGTAVEQRREDAEGWLHPLPNAVNVVVSRDRWVTLTGGEHGEGLHAVVRYRYGDGYYDGEHRQFRGFARVTEEELPDSDADGQEGGLRELSYFVGHGDVYIKGKLERERLFSGPEGKRRPIREEVVKYDDCDVEGAPTDGLRFDVRFICELERTTVLQEGAEPARWVTTRRQQEYNGFGQLKLEADLGVIHHGAPGAASQCSEQCARDGAAFGLACGAQCTGDERYVERQFVEPSSADDPWILDRPHTVHRYGRKGGKTSEERRYYDGEDFVGLPLGQLTSGLLTRATERISEESDAVVERIRRAYDRHGNLVERIEPTGSLTVTDDHRRRYKYDGHGLRMARTDVLVKDRDGVPHSLRREYVFNTAFDKLAEVTDWMLVEDGEVTTPRNATRYRYDAFGQSTAALLPGDPEGQPSIEYRFDYGTTSSAYTVLRRSQRGGELDLERVNCMDGRGRPYQSRVRVGDGRFQVSGFKAFNARGMLVRDYQPYSEGSATCAQAAPTDVLFERSRFDVRGRIVQSVRPDGVDHGADSVVRFEHGPLYTAYHDEEDSADGQHAGTPTVRRQDGLGRLIAVEHQLAGSAEPIRVQAEFDGLGNLSALIDARGNRKRQQYDLVSQVVEIEDPNSGKTLLEYDASGMVTARTDGRGVTVRTEYDAMGRPLSRFRDGSREQTEVRWYHDRAPSCPGNECSFAVGRVAEVQYPLPQQLADLVQGAPRGTDHHGYDPRGQRVYEGRTLVGLPLITRHEFDNAGREIRTTFPDGEALTRTFDGLSRATSLSGAIERMEYDERGLDRTAAFANGVVESYAYDAARWRSGHSAALADGAMLWDVAYERDRAGNVLSERDAATNDTPWGPLDFDYTYDSLYRLVEVSGMDGSVEQAFGYDELDNLLSVGEGASGNAMRYDGTQPNAVTEAAGLTMRYDDAGNLTQRGDVAYEWDHQGRLARASRAETLLAGFGYGAGPERVASLEGNSMTLYASADFEVRDGMAVTYARLGRRRVARFESSVIATTLLGDPAPVDAGDGEVNAADGWVLRAANAGLLEADPSRVRARAGLMLRAAARRLLLDEGDAYAALHADHLGSIVAATDAEGDVRGRRHFATSGAMDLADGYVDRYGFTGQEEFRELGLVRFRHRWLDPTTRRWTQPDPAFNHVHSLSVRRSRESADPYAYVNNRFPNYIDREGLDLGLPDLIMWLIAEGAPAVRQWFRRITGREARAQRRVSQEVREFNARAAEAHAQQQRQIERAYQAKNAAMAELLATRSRTPDVEEVRRRQVARRGGRLTQAGTRARSNAARRPAPGSGGQGGGLARRGGGRTSRLRRLFRRGGR